MGGYANQVAGFGWQSVRVEGVNPQWVGVCDLVQPLGIGAAGVNENGHTKRRDETVLAGLVVHRFFSDMTLDIGGSSHVGPTPVRECPREIFQLAAWGGKSLKNSAVNIHADVVA